MHQLIAKRNKPARTLPVGEALNPDGSAKVYASGRSKGQAVLEYLHVRTGAVYNIGDAKAAYLAAHLTAAGIAGDYILRPLADSPRHQAKVAALAAMTSKESRAKAKAKAAARKTKAPKNPKAQG